MPYSLHYREELDESTSRELDDLLAHLKAFLLKEHNEDGTHNFGLPGQNGFSGESALGLSLTNPSFQFLISSLFNDSTFMEQLAANSGTGDVVGPASAVSGNLATFNGTTGKLIQDGGFALSSIERLTVVDTSIDGTYAANDSMGTMIAAQGANTIIEVDGWAIDNNTTDNSAAGAGSVVLEYVGSATDLVGAISLGLTLQQRNYQRDLATAHGYLNFTAGFDPRNVAVELVSTGAITGPMHSNLRVFIWWHLLTLP